jgi:KWG Leptospira.
MLTLFGSCGGGLKIKELKLFPVLSGNNWQYVDREGKTVINPQFGDASVFRDGIALVQTSSTDAKWGFIDEDGKYAIMPSYLSATIFSEGLAWVVSKNEAPIAINEKGEIKINLKDAQTVAIFKEGLAAFSIVDSSGLKWGFVDKEGKVVINPQFSSADNFCNDKCAVENADGKWGYIDKDGKIIINYQFDGAENFINGKAIVVSDGKYGVINDQGKYIINPQFNGMVNDGGKFLINQNDKWGWCDKDGKININPQFEYASPFNGGNLAAVKSGDMFGYIDKEGKIVINPQFEDAYPFNGNIALVRNSNKYGFIDKEGKYLVNPQFDQIKNDLRYYLFNGSSQFETVKTNYFNVDVITARIKKKITDKSVAGLNFDTPISTIMSKLKITQNDFSKYSNENQVVSENITNDASLDFYIIGNPWTQSYNGWFSFNYSFNQNYKPQSYAYRINLKNNGYGKEDLVIKSLINAMTGYSKDTTQSDENETTLKSDSLTLNFFKKNGVVIVIRPSDKKKQE